MSASKDEGTYKKHKVHKGDSIFLSRGYIVFNGFNTDIKDPRYAAQQGDIAVSALLNVYDLKGQVASLAPIYYIRGQMENHVEDTLSSMCLQARFARIIPEEDAAEIEVKQSDPMSDYIVLKAIVFPYINVLWLGIIVMVIGFIISLAHRYGQKQVKVDMPSVDV